MGRFTLEALEKFVMDAIDTRMYSHPDREGVKSLISSRFEIYRLSVQTAINGGEV